MSLSCQPIFFAWLGSVFRTDGHWSCEKKKKKTRKCHDYPKYIPNTKQTKSLSFNHMKGSQNLGPFVKTLPTATNILKKGSHLPKPDPKRSQRPGHLQHLQWLPCVHGAPGIDRLLEAPRTSWGLAAAKGGNCWRSSSVCLSFFNISVWSFFNV